MIVFDYADNLRRTRSDLLDQMYILRAQSFFERRGWSVEVRDNKEIDRFDAMNPLYVLSVAPSGQLLASLRLLPTTGPHMLSDVFPETMTGARIIRHPLILESSRFCVDTAAANHYMSTGVNTVTGELLVGLFEIALKAAVVNVVSVYDLFVERILRRAGCRFNRLGEPFVYDGLRTVAGVFEVSQEAIDSIRQRSEIHGDVFAIAEDGSRFSIRA
ncbi:acyl-homoserine-lactone synthase [Halomonas heilongjiangensis]|uniref:Acyl-homoserine-lactone synthase n=1 Tax=Halomonas heilongjiangensis TaxID=1387883 RepID=A0A2N7TQF5_9GAMM|nr:acyl-homoserine-lactone synthase [Halomonas heilongjiangensis]PMR70430.1 acyl-homoserine-lactone synthase [Halomonas heilongjiangensis]PXX91391.1 acyl-homoserine-lactone synthase [Halomonas heilongjiangensis]